MLQEPFIFLGILIISLVLKYILFRENAGILKPIAMRIFFIGVIFHELAHYVMSLVVGHIPEHIKIKWRDEYFGIRNPHGEVEIKKRKTFLQAFLIALAPLYISTWLIFYLWFVVPVDPRIHVVLKVIAVFIGFSLLITAAPSAGDLKVLTGSFRYNLRHTLYQVFLISLSIGILWIILVIFQLVFVIEFFYYISIAGIYHLLRFSILGINLGINKVFARDYTKPHKVKMKPITRRQYKPKKPHTKW